MGYVRMSIAKIAMKEGEEEEEALAQVPARFGFDTVLRGLVLEAAAAR